VFERRGVYVHTRQSYYETRTFHVQGDDDWRAGPNPGGADLEGRDRPPTTSQWSGRALSRNTRDRSGQPTSSTWASRVPGSHLGASGAGTPRVRRYTPGRGAPGRALPRPCPSVAAATGGGSRRAGPSSGTPGATRGAAPSWSGRPKNETPRRRLTDARLDALIEAGCDDATFSAKDDLTFAAFIREAGNLLDAVVSATS
jgi:hypothetical protein